MRFSEENSITSRSVANFKRKQNKPIFLWYGMPSLAAELIQCGLCGFGKTAW